MLGYPLKIINGTLQKEEREHFRIIKDVGEARKNTRALYTSIQKPKEQRIEP